MNEISHGAHIQIDGRLTFRNFATVEVVHQANLIVGKRVFFNSNAVLRCHHRIEIGDDTMFGDGVKLYDFDHKFSNYHVEKLAFKSAPIRIGKNCWIGANSVILKGVTIGDNTIIGAGCTISKDIPANSIVTTKNQFTIRNRKQFQHHVTTFTASDRLEHLAYLAENLPHVAFHIVASVYISPYLDSFRQYPNINIYSNIHEVDIDQSILAMTDIYLDINHGPEKKNAVEQAYQLGIPIVAFDSLAHRKELAHTILPDSDKESMVQTIQQLLASQ
ncbi:TPA: exopolysaccharide biosynthesis protein [Streptococcus suis]|nr:exopolysaccharide biosynthesis protein [Streptococcus suis]HEM5149898.1 exopolysaccharide biosynthesis protein [Streptococcus suis]